MTRRGWILLFAVGVIWGIPYLLIKIAVGEVTPAMVVFVRTGARRSAAAAVRAARGRAAACCAVTGDRCSAFAALEIIGPWILLSNAETTLASSTTGLLIATVPIIAVILGRLVGDRRPVAAHPVDRAARRSGRGRPPARAGCRQRREPVGGRAGAARGRGVRQRADDRRPVPARRPGDPADRDLPRRHGAVLPARRPGHRTAPVAGPRRRARAGRPRRHLHGARVRAVLPAHRRGRRGPVDAGRLSQPGRRGRRSARSCSTRRSRSRSSRRRRSSWSAPPRRRAGRARSSRPPTTSTSWPSRRTGYRRPDRSCGRVKVRATAGPGAPVRCHAARMSVPERPVAQRPVADLRAASATRLDDRPTPRSCSES